MRRAAAARTVWVHTLDTIADIYPSTPDSMISCKTHRFSDKIMRQH